MAEHRKWELAKPAPQWLVDLAVTEGGDKFIEGWRTNLPGEGVRVVGFDFDAGRLIQVDFDSALWQEIGDHGSADSALQKLLAEHRRRRKSQDEDAERAKKASEEMRHRFTE